VYVRRVDPSDLAFSLHHTDTHILVFPLALALSIHNKQHPMVPVTVTSGHVYDDVPRLLFLHEDREASILTTELPQESEQFRFL
jgi:hypothetical protein